MTQEEKQLLLKDLSARLPYDIIVRVHDIKYGDFDSYIDSISNTCVEAYPIEELTIDFNPCVFYKLQDIRPYLRPMSSMTEEEIEEYRNLSDEVIGSYGPYHHEFIAHCVRLGIKPDNPHECVDDFLNMEAIDWLNAHHFDYRGLIPMGLALEAPEDMYKN